MKVEAKLFWGNKPGPCMDVADEDASRPFHKQMERCLLELCKGLNIPIPVWMPQNTRELGRFRRTTFTAEQFLEPVSFDRLVLSLL